MVTERGEDSMTPSLNRGLTVDSIPGPHGQSLELSVQTQQSSFLLPRYLGGRDFAHSGLFGPIL